MKAISKFVPRSANLPAPAAGTDAIGAASKPRLITDVTVREVESIAPGMGATVKKQGLKGSAFVTWAKKNPKKAAAIGVAAALGSTEGYDDLVALASAGIDVVSDIAQTALDQVDEIESEAGFNTFTPGEDGEVASIDVNEIEVIATLVEKAEESLEAAIAAMGGLNRLLAVEAWRAIDPDLRALVLKRRLGA